MLRAVRFACKLGFAVEPETERPLFALAHLLGDVAAARLFDELIKLFTPDTGSKASKNCVTTGCSDSCFPTRRRVWPGRSSRSHHLRQRGLTNTDRRIAQEKPVTAFFLFAILLWEPVRRRYEQLVSAGKAENDAIFQAAEEICARQHLRVSIRSGSRCPCARSGISSPLGPAGG